MKIVMANLMLACVSLIVLSLIFTGISKAEFDLKDVAGMWLFDDGKGDVAADSSENGKDGELVNGPKWIKNGQFGSALEFDGNESKGHVVVGDLGLSGAVTLVLWANPSDAADDDRLISNISGPTNPAFTTRFQGGTVEVWSSAWKPVIPDFDDNKWGHYAFVFDGEGNVTGYYNGKEGDTVADSYTFTEIGIGANFLDTWGQYFSGQFDEVAFFSIALTEDDIEVLVTKGLKSALAVYPADKLATTWGNIKTGP
ncbi:MAG: LamG domain-containing protein [Candidatus Poribacteria bacterium]|nr:LamG domain-containing protein [Candidatus Poribacteria bacterium]